MAAQWASKCRSTLAALNFSVQADRGPPERASLVPIHKVLLHKSALGRQENVFSCVVKNGPSPPLTSYPTEFPQAGTTLLFELNPQLGKATTGTFEAHSHTSHLLFSSFFLERGFAQLVVKFVRERNQKSKVIKLCCER